MYGHCACSECEITLTLGVACSDMSKDIDIDIYTNKIGDCLFICLFIYLSVCSAMGGQTARPNGLKFGG